MDIFLTTVLQSQHNKFEAYKEHILLGHDSIESKEHSHPLLTPLLQTFEHVFPSEIPHGLHPKRSIQHKINLIPGSTFPNKLAY